MVTKRDYKKEFLRYTAATSKYTLPKSLVSDVDTEIRSAVVDLNKHGLKTMLSCAGHLWPGKRPHLTKTWFKAKNEPVPKEKYYGVGYGYILFRNTGVKKGVGYNKDQAFDIMKKHGLTGLRQYQCRYMEIPSTLVIFNPVGKPPAIKDDIGSGFMVDVMTTRG